LWNLICRPIVPVDSRIPCSTARLGPPPRTYRHCVVRSIFDNDNNYYCHRGELDGKHELASGVHVCVNIIYYYTDTYTGLQYVYIGTKTGEWPLLHRPPPKLPARVRVGDIWPVKTAQEVNPFWFARCKLCWCVN